MTTPTPVAGILSYGTYLPYWRLERASIGTVLGTRAGKGTRAVASFDEDTTTLGVEAARAALRHAPAGHDPLGIIFATTDPAYVDKTNATAIHAALQLPRHSPAFDYGGSVRSGIGAIQAGHAQDRFLVVLSDRRTGAAGGPDESEGGDGAAALLFGSGPDVIAEGLGQGFATAEFLDRWRVAGEPFSRVWEERFGEHAYLPLVNESLDDALKGARLSRDQIDHLAITGVHSRAIRSAAARSGTRPDAIVADHVGSIGNTGTAHPGFCLATALDHAAPGDVVALTVLADGAATYLWRATDALPRWRAQRPAGASVAAQVAAQHGQVSYATFLSWRGLLRREPPRRPDPVPPAAPAAFRNEAWKFAFVAGLCTQCGTRALPPERVCRKCGSTDAMGTDPMADVQGTISTFTIDRIAYTPSPPLVAAVINFDGGGRFRCELTDVDPDAVRVGDRVQMSSRLIFTENGIRNYFWKAIPARASETSDVREGALP